MSCSLIQQNDWVEHLGLANLNYQKKVRLHYREKRIFEHEHNFQGRASKLLCCLTGHSTLRICLKREKKEFFKIVCHF